MRQTIRTHWKQAVSLRIFKMLGDVERMIFGLLVLPALGWAGIAVWLRFGWQLRRSWASLALRPTERMSSNQLSGYLLSAHLSVAGLDNFNQLASARPPRRVRQQLRRRWNLKSAIECRRSLELRLARLAETSTEALAWEIQQLAYITRLGFTVGYVSREMAESTLARLQFAARTHHDSWADYLSASLATARDDAQAHDPVAWRRFERSHDLLLHAPESPVRRVGLTGRPQGRSPAPAAVLPMA